MHLSAIACLARQRVPVLHRSIATTVTSTPAPSSPSTAAPIRLSNVEASWTKLTPEEKASVHQQLEEIQKKDWKELSIDEKKAGEFYFCPPGASRGRTGVSVYAYRIRFPFYICPIPLDVFYRTCFLAYYVAFGPHGPRTPSSQPGDALKILLFTSALVAVAGTLFIAIRSAGTCIFRCL